VQAQDISFSAELKLPGKFAVKKKKMEQKGVSTLTLQPQISSLHTCVDVCVKVTSSENLQQQTSHLRTVCYPCSGSAVLYSLSSACDLKGASVCPV